MAARKKKHKRRRRTARKYITTPGNLAIRNRRAYLILTDHAGHKRKWFGKEFEIVNGKVERMT